MIQVFCVSKHSDLVSYQLFFPCDFIISIEALSWVDSAESFGLIQLNHLNWFNLIKYLKSINLSIPKKSVFINTQPAGIGKKAAASEDAANQVSFIINFIQFNANQIYQQLQH